MDTTYEEPSIYSPIEGYGASAIESEANPRNVAASPPIGPITNSNALSPFSSLTTGTITPLVSSCTSKFEEQQHDECSDPEEESSGMQADLGNVPTGRTSYANSRNNDIVSSQGSSSTFSPFSSPVSSPLSENALSAPLHGYTINY